MQWFSKFLLASCVFVLCAPALISQEVAVLDVKPGTTLHYRIGFGGDGEAFQTVVLTLSTKTPLRADQPGFLQSFKSEKVELGRNDLVFTVPILIPDWAADGVYEVSVTAYAADPRFNMTFDNKDGISLPLVRVENTRSFTRPQITVVRQK